jgi:hypothetical protein
VALIIFGRTENPLAKQAIAFRLVRPVVDGFWLEDLPFGVAQNLLR